MLARGRRHPADRFTRHRAFRAERATLQSALRELGREGQDVSRIVDGRSAEAGDWRFVDPLFASWVSMRGRVQRGS